MQARSSRNIDKSWFGVEGKDYYAATVRMVLTFNGCLRGTNICATRTEDL